MGHNKNYHYAYKEGFFPSIQDPGKCTLFGGTWAFRPNKGLPSDKATYTVLYTS